MLGHFAVFLQSQCWCARFGELTAINNILPACNKGNRRRLHAGKTTLGGRGDGQKLKKQRWVEVSQVFLLRL